MLRIEAGRTARYCDGVSRRSFLQLGAVGLGTASLPRILQAKQESAALGRAQKDTSVILIWLDGGPSHLDMYDMKPEAPAEYRGLWKPIPTNVPGMEISELFPRQAKVADKFSIVRSLHHDQGDHFAGGHMMLTGRYEGVNGGDTQMRSPSLGAIATKVCGARREGMPGYVAVPYAASIGLRPGYFAGSYLGIQHNPFETDGDPSAANFKVNNMQLSQGLSIDRLESRHALLKHFDRIRREVDTTRAMETMDRFEREAYDLVAGSAARTAFDIGSEDAKTRDLYGRNHLGQCTLLARRLVEAGSTFVTVHSGGWDHHWNLKASLESYLPQVDMAVSGLLEDLHARGLSEKVLVMMCGEFSRTPRMNDGGNGGAPMSMGTPGRDHWGNAMFCLLAGGGVKGGRIYGSTNSRGEVPKDNPVECCDILATVYRVLGVDPRLNFLNTAGRPVPVLDRGRAIEELF
jgi:uncharacterized protein (DUF1501 family)